MSKIDGMCRGVWLSFNFLCSKLGQSTGRPAIGFCCEASGRLPYVTGRLPYATGRLPYGTGRLPIGVCGEATGHLYCSFSGLKAV